MLQKLFDRLQALPQRVGTDVEQGQDEQRPEQLVKRFLVEPQNVAEAVHLEEVLAVAVTQQRLQQLIGPQLLPCLDREPALLRGEELDRGDSLAGRRFFQAEGLES